MKDKVFVDTNVLIYLYSDDEPTKQTTAIDVMERFHCSTSTQALNEFCSVCLRKLKMPSEAILQSIAEIITECELCYIDYEVIHKALQLHSDYGFNYYDCLIMASALLNNCNFLLSEDMQNGQIIEGTLTVKNPFLIQFLPIVKSE
jgi:predicted nucleic acid-binding protein